MPDAFVVSEPRVYSIDSPHSFFRDVQRSALGHRDAQQRLERHVQEVSSHIERGTPEGRRAVLEYEQHARCERPDLTRSQVHREIRAATSSTLTGFTTPQYVIDQYAIHRAKRRVFANQCHKLPLPSVGLTIHVPSFSTAASAGVQAEGGAVTELDPSDTDLVENVQTIAGQIVISQQLLDRTQNAPNGPTYDVVIYEQLRSYYDAQLNNYVLGKAVGAGAQVAGSSSFTMANFYADLALAREELTDTTGTRLQPTHVFTTSDLYSYVTRQVDDQHRPILQPAFAPGVPVWPSDGDVDAWNEFSGVVLPGVLMWFLDEGIQPSGSNTQIVISRPEKILLFEGDPVVRAFPQTLGNDLQVVVQMYNYAACVPRYPSGTATITGNAYPTSAL